MQQYTNFSNVRRQERSLWDKFWKNRRGEVVVWQFPNVWLIGWAVVTFISLFIGGNVGNIMSDIAIVLLAIWSLFEIFKGDNGFRRVLGAVVLLYVVATALKTIF